jgi:hypothetical protein
LVLITSWPSLAAVEMLLFGTVLTSRIGSPRW